MGNRRSGGADAPEWLAAFPGFGALILVLGLSLKNGAYAPLDWTLLAVGLLAMLAVQTALDLRFGVPAKALRAIGPGLIYGAMLVWLLVQVNTGLPFSLAHPVWQMAPEGAEPTISATPESGRAIVLRLTCYAVAFWLALRAACVEDRAGRLLRLFAVFSTLLAAYGIVAKLTGVNPLLGDEGAGGPVRAGFVNRNTYATFAVFGALANVTAYYRVTFSSGALTGTSGLRDFLEEFFARGWVFALGTLICFSALAMTASRAGNAAGLIGLVVLVWGLRRRHGGGNKVLWVLPALLVGFVALVMTSDVVDRMANTDSDARFEVFPYVIEGIVDRPFLGHGAGSFLHTFRPYVPLDAAFAEWTHAHSSYLENAFEYGIPAALALYVALALIGGRLVRGVLRRRRNRSIPAFALACFVAAAFHATLDFSLQYPGVSAVFAMILGIGWAESFTREETRRRRSAAARRRPAQQAG